MKPCLNPLNTSCQFNSSNNTNIDVITKPLPFYVFLIIEATVTIIGNGLLCWLFFTQRKLRTKQNHFIISLSFSDLLVGFAVLPCEYCHWEAENIVRSNETCAIFCGSLISFNMAASVINLVMIGADRYLSVEKPFLYEEIFSKTRALIVIAAGWSLAIFLTILPIFWAMIPTLFPKTKYLINIIFTGSMFSLTLFVGILLFVFYQRIIAIVRSKVPANERRSTGIKVCILSTILFFVCWIPSTITEILIQTKISVPHLIGDISYFVLMLGPALDPVLYAYYRKDFRGCLLEWWKEKLLSLQNCYDSICCRSASRTRELKSSKEQSLISSFNTSTKTA